MLFEQQAEGGPVIFSISDSTKSFPQISQKEKCVFINELVASYGPIRDGTRWTPSGDLIIYPTTKRQKESMLALRSHVGYNISTRLAKSETESKGIARIPTNYSEDDLLSSLGDQNVIKVQRSYKGAGPDRTPLPLVILTFGSNSLPGRILLAQESFLVEIYIPRSMQCFRCWSFGHTSLNCSNSARCPKCALHHPETSLTDFKNSPKCPNCNQTDHQAGSNRCPILKSRQEVIRHAFLNNISISEASNFLTNPVQRLRSPMASLPKRPLPIRATHSRRPL